MESADRFDEVEIRVGRAGERLSLQVPSVEADPLSQALREAGFRPTWLLQESASVPDYVTLFLAVGADAATLAVAIRAFLSGSARTGKITARVDGNVVESDGMDADEIVRIINALKDR